MPIPKVTHVSSIACVAVEDDIDLARERSALLACLERFHARLSLPDPACGLSLGCAAIPPGAVAIPASELPTPIDPRADEADRRADDEARAERRRPCSTPIRR